MSTYRPLPAPVALANAAALPVAANATSGLIVFDAVPGVVELVDGLGLLASFEPYADEYSAGLLLQLRVAPGADVYTVWCAIRDNLPLVGGFCYA